MNQDQNSRTIVATFEGPEVARGRVSVPDFVRLLDGIQQSLFIAGQNLMGRNRSPGPIPQTYTEQLTLELVATEPGSFTATLELPRQTSPTLVDFGQEALNALLDGLEAEVTGRVDHGLSSDALTIIEETIIKAVPRNSRLVIRGGTVPHEIVITPNTVLRDRKVAVVIPAMSPRQRKRLVGRLLEIDFRDRTAEIWDAANKMVRVSFDETLADPLKASARMQVIVEGEEELDSQGRPRRLQIDHLTPVDLPDKAFWSNPSIEQLAIDQGVPPFESIQNLSAPSLANEDPEALIAELMNLRAK